MPTCYYWCDYPACVVCGTPDSKFRKTPHNRLVSASTTTIGEHISAQFREQFKFKIGSDDSRLNQFIKRIDVRTMTCTDAATIRSTEETSTKPLPNFKKLIPKHYKSYDDALKEFGSLVVKKCEPHSSNKRSKPVQIVSSSYSHDNEDKTNNKKEETKDLKLYLNSITDVSKDQDPATKSSPLFCELLEVEHDLVSDATQQPSLLLSDYYNQILLHYQGHLETSRRRNKILKNDVEESCSDIVRRHMNEDILCQQYETRIFAHKALIVGRFIATDQDTELQFIIDDLIEHVQKIQLIVILRDTCFGDLESVYEQINPEQREELIRIRRKELESIRNMVSSSLLTKAYQTATTDGAVLTNIPPITDNKIKINKKRKTDI